MVSLQTAVRPADNRPKVFYLSEGGYRKSFRGTAWKVMWAWLLS